MKLKIIMAIICVYWFISCTKESNTFSSTIAVNKTNHKIVVLPFQNGVIQKNDSFSLFPLTQKEILNFENRGIGLGISYGSLTQYNDSIRVVFDDTFIISHYKPRPLGNNPKFYFFTSRRNLFNDTSYTKELLNESSSHKSWRFTYTFTEQDYLDAK